MLLQDIPVGLPPRCKTFSAGTVPEDFSTDTLKRRRKFSWVKSNFMRRKSDKKISGSQTDLNANRFSVTSLNETSGLHYAPDPLRKSVSLELLPTALESEDMASQIVLQDGRKQFQGYLR